MYAKKKIYVCVKIYVCENKKFFWENLCAAEGGGGGGVLYFGSELALIVLLFRFYSQIESLICIHHNHFPEL